MGYYTGKLMGMQAEAVSGIVTDGLQLYLDASNPASYPGSGTTWFDLSGNGNNGTLVNGVGFSNGVMVFDGVNDRVDLPSTTLFIDTTQPFTLSAWVKLSAFTPQYPMLFNLKTNSTSSFVVFMSAYNDYLGVDFGGVAFYRGKTNTATTFFIGNWVKFDLVYNGLGHTVGTNYNVYLNNVDTAHNASYIFGASPNTLNRIGIRNDGNADTAFNGSQNDHLIYNRALTPEEVNHNFNATKSKYGL